jgi:hypothetical protein
VAGFNWTAIGTSAVVATLLLVGAAYDFRRMETPFCRSCLSGIDRIYEPIAGKESICNQG